MTDNEIVHKLGLPKLTNNGTNNNYGKWATKVYHKLDEWDLLKYIEGPTSEPPIIPPLCKTTTYHGFDPNDIVTSVCILGNCYSWTSHIVQID